METVVLPIHKMTQVDISEIVMEYTQDFVYIHVDVCRCMYMWIARKSIYFEVGLINKANKNLLFISYKLSKAFWR